MNKILLGILAVSVLALIYYKFNPSDIAIFPKCPFLLLTGLKCPGCGSQRAIHSLLHFDIFGAIRYNLLFVLSLPLIVILSYAEIMRNKKPALYIKLHKAKFIWFIFGTVILWWIIRNIFDI